MKRVILLSVFLSGCVPAINTIEPLGVSGAFVKSELGKSPELNKITRMEIGDSIYSEFNYSLTGIPKIVTAENGTAFNKAVPAGTVLMGMKISGVESYCHSSVGFQSGWHPCFADTDKDGAFDKATNLANGFDNSFKALSRKIKYTKKIDKTTKTGFRKEIIYQGLSNGKITIAYREFNNDFARPAFSQTVSYDVNSKGGALIGFKGVRINVIKASGIYIDYIVTRGFR